MEVRYNPGFFNRHDKMYLDTLIAVLDENGVCPWYYTIGEYGDDSICIEKNGKEYTVFFGERGQKKRQKSFERIFDSCLHVINSLPYDKKTVYMLETDFAKQVDRRRDLRFRLKRIGRPFSDAASS